MWKSCEGSCVHTLLILCPFCHTYKGCISTVVNEAQELGILPIFSILSEAVLTQSNWNFPKQGPEWFRG